MLFKQFDRPLCRVSPSFAKTLASELRRFLFTKLGIASFCVGQSASTIIPSAINVLLSASYSALQGHVSSISLTTLLGFRTCGDKSLPHGGHSSFGFQRHAGQI